jgi:hypothetical protein
MDPTLILILALSFFAVIVILAVVRQRRLGQTYMAAQREVLDRQKEGMAIQSEILQAQRESVRLLGLIAENLKRGLN